MEVATPLSIEVIEDPLAACVALDPIRNRLLSAMGSPVSASNLADRVGLTRQKVNYHLKALEAHGLIRPTETRRWGGLTERLYVATASSYLVSPAALGAVASDPEREQDRLSAGYLVALAARIVREVGSLFRRATEANKALATLAIDAQIDFRSAADRAEFTRELTATVTDLVQRYHAPQAAGSRAHRLLVFAHPLPLAPAESPERSGTGN